MSVYKQQHATQYTNTNLQLIDFQSKLSKANVTASADFLTQARTGNFANISKPVPQSYRNYEEESVMDEEVEYDDSHDEEPPKVVVISELIKKSQGQRRTINNKHQNKVHTTIEPKTTDAP